jgi:hypothetical protein
MGFTKTASTDRTWQIPASPGREADIVRVGLALRRLPLDKTWVLELREHKRKRSESQNRYLWGAVYPTILANMGETMAGWTAQDLHEYFLGECFGWEELAGFGRRRIKPVRRSSALNKQEFSDFVTFIQARMADQGVTIPEAA